MDWKDCCKDNACVPTRWIHIDAYSTCIVVHTTGYDICRPKTLNVCGAVLKFGHYFQSEWDSECWKEQYYDEKTCDLCRWLFAMFIQACIHIPHHV